MKVSSPVTRHHQEIGFIVLILSLGPYSSYFLFSCRLEFSSSFCLNLCPFSCPLPSLVLASNESHYDNVRSVITVVILAGVLLSPSGGCERFHACLLSPALSPLDYPG